MATQFPPFTLDEFRPTLDTLHKSARVLNIVRSVLAPKIKHWWHASLSTNATGLTTTPMLAGDKTVEISLNFVSHKIVAATSHGEQWHQPLGTLSQVDLRDALLAQLTSWGITVPDFDQGKLADEQVGIYEQKLIARYWQALSQIDLGLKAFRSSLREECGPVVLWAHHMDIAFLWFSGRLVPGQDPANEEYADEQMNFGFSPGDDSVPEPYFYITAYPTPEGWVGNPLPDEAHWQTEGFSAAILPYSALVTADDPHGLLASYLRAGHDAGAALMK